MLCENFIISLHAICKDAVGRRVLNSIACHQHWLMATLPLRKALTFPASTFVPKPNEQVFVNKSTIVFNFNYNYLFNIDASKASNSQERNHVGPTESSTAIHPPSKQ